MSLSLLPFPVSQKAIKVIILISLDVVNPLVFLFDCRYYCQNWLSPFVTQCLGNVQCLLEIVSVGWVDSIKGQPNSRAGPNPTTRRKSVCLKLRLIMKNYSLCEHVRFKWRLMGGKILIIKINMNRSRMRYFHISVVVIWIFLSHFLSFFHYFYLEYSVCNRYL